MVLQIWGSERTKMYSLRYSIL